MRPDVVIVEGIHAQLVVRAQRVVGLLVDRRARGVDVVAGKIGVPAYHRRPGNIL